MTRGGGSVEDLLPFSDEGLVRAVAACRTPVVSAIGHEQDTPLLDLVADVRASTPTDAARRVVPDVGEELQRIVTGRQRARAAVLALVERRAAAARHRTQPAGARATRSSSSRDAARPSTSSANGRLAPSTYGCDRAADEIGHLRARVVALSPAATLERGYAVVQLPDGTVVRDPEDVPSGQAVHVRVAAGGFDATRTG